MGTVDFAMVDSAAHKKPSKKSDSYENHSSRDRFSIGKNASIYGIAPPVRKWKNTYPTLDESTVRGFKKRYKFQVKEVTLKNKSPRTVIVNKLRGSPCLIGNKIDPLVQKYLKATRYKGGVVDTLVTMASEMY